MTISVFFGLVYAALFISLEETMEDSIIYLPQTRSSGLREILVGAANPRSIFMRSDVHDTMEDGTKCITRLSTRDSFKKIVQRPAFWYVPRSVDVARVLTAAQHAHLSRVKKGLKCASDPITIVDVGNGYGDLSALILATARKQRLRVTCQVVSLQASTIQTQKEVYRSTRELSFFCESQLQMLLRIWGDQPHIVSEISALAERITRSKEPLFDLRRLGQVYTTNFNARNISLGDVHSYTRILKEDFGIKFPSDFVIRSGTLYQLFERGVQFTQFTPLLEFMAKKYSDIWIKRLERVEDFLVKSKECGADMVLQTQTSLDHGVSAYVRLVRAGIVGHVFDCGTRKQDYRSTPRADTTSFNVVDDCALGDQYAPSCVWKGVSVKESTKDGVGCEDIFATFSRSGCAAQKLKRKVSKRPQPLFLLHGCTYLLDSEDVYKVVNNAKSLGMFGWEKSQVIKEVVCTGVTSLQDVSHYSIRNIKRVVRR